MLLNPLAGWRNIRYCYRGTKVLFENLHSLGGKDGNDRLLWSYVAGDKELTPLKIGLIGKSDQATYRCSYVGSGRSTPIISI